MKTHRWKKIGLILCIPAVVLIIIGAVAPRLLDLNRYQVLIVSKLEESIGGQVKLGRISWGISHRIWLEVNGLSVTNASAFSGDVNLTRIYTSISILQLITKKVVVKNLEIDGSEVTLKLNPAKKDKGPSSINKKPAGVPLPVEVKIEQAVIDIARFELDDALTLPGKRLVHILSDLALKAIRSSA